MNTPKATGFVRTIQRANGPTYYAQLRLPDGRQPKYRLGLVWGKRSRPAAGYLTAAQAAAELERILAGERDDIDVGPRRDRPTFKTISEEWLADRARECRESTIHDYRHTVRGTLRPYFGDDTIAETITTADINAYRDKLLDDGRAGRTVNKRLVALHGIYELAIDRHGLRENPVARAKRAKQKRRKLEQYLTAPEVLLLAERADTEQDADLYQIAAWTGLRFGELKALRLGDINYADALIYVNRNWPVHGSEDDPKSGKPRAVPLWDQAAVILDKISRRDQLNGDTDYVFLGPAGDPLGYDWTIQRFKVARNAAKLQSPRPNPRTLTFHDLRHTYGTLAARLYGNLHMVQEYMGHESITTTELYAHFTPRTDAASVGTAGLAALLSPDPTATGQQDSLPGAAEGQRRGSEPATGGATESN